MRTYTLIIHDILIFTRSTISVLFFMSAISQPVDYENVKNFVLGLTVRNKAPPFSGGSSWQWGGEYKIYPIKINVKNQPEGPHFDPKVKAIAISKKDTSFNITDVVASNPAIDQDTGELAENVRSVHTHETRITCYLLSTIITGLWPISDVGMPKAQTQITG